MQIQKIYWWIKTQFLRLKGLDIGFKSYVANPISIIGGSRIIIGKEVRIYPGVRMETHFSGSIIISDDVSIGQNFHITSANEKLIIGKHSTISGNVFITNIDHDYKEIGVHILKQQHIVTKTEIGENCFIGYGAAIQAGTILGKQCVVGANSVVKGAFADYSVIVGAPARVVKKYDFENKCWRKV